MVVHLETMSEKHTIDLLVNSDIWPVAFIQSAKFRSFIDAIPEALIVSNERGRIVQVNDSARKLFNYTLDEFLSLTIEALVPEALKDKHIAMRASFFDNPRARVVGSRLSSLTAVKKGNKSFPMESSLFAIITDEGLLAINLLRDITEQYQQTEALSHRAFYDELTGLGNRHYFNQLIDGLMQRSTRDKTILALLYMDLDKFKQINDTYGHELGDIVLAKIAKRVKASLRVGDFVFRFGGDEFIMLLFPNDRQGVEKMAGRIIKACEEPVIYHGDSFQLSASIGVAFHAKDKKAQALINEADRNMYKAKSLGGSQVVVP